MIQSFAVLTKTGKVIVARQNVPFTRTKIEGLYATFTRMVTTTPHSSFEAESVRFVYRLIEDVYFVIITTLSSNIIEDTEILNAVIASVQTKMTITSKTVTQQMYEILFIIDEYLQWGFCEKLSVQNVRTNLAMRSRDEEIYLHQLELKKQEAARIAKQKAEEIREEKEMKEKLEMIQRMQNNLDSMTRSPTTGYSPVSNDYIPPSAPQKQQPQPKKQPTKKTTKQTKGLTLGKKHQAETLIQEIKKEEQIVDEEIIPQKQINANTQSTQQQIQPKQNQKKQEKKLMLTSCIVRITEDSQITVNTESSTVSLSLSGSLAVGVAEGCNPEIILKQAQLAAKAQMNPAIDQKAFTQRIVKVKEGKKFSVNSPAVYVKWNMKSTDYELPITFTCWPAESDNGLTLSLSYESIQEMKDVIVEIPKLGNVMINGIEGGEVNEENDKIYWIIGNVDENGSGSLEIEIEGENLELDSLFPINVKYLVENTLTGNDVETVIVNGEEVEFEKEIILKSTYQILK